MITSWLGVWEYMNFSCLHTFEVQIFSAIDDLTHCLGINFERVDVTVVSSDDNVMPLVVMESSVTVALDYIGPVAEIKHIMYVPKRQQSEGQFNEKVEMPYLYSIPTLTAVL